MGKTGDFGAKNNKETYIFLKRGSFQSGQVRKAQQRIFLKRDLLERPRSKM